MNKLARPQFYFGIGASSFFSHSSLGFSHFALAMGFTSDPHHEGPRKLSGESARPVEYRVAHPQGRRTVLLHGARQELTSLPRGVGMLACSGVAPAFTPPGEPPLTSRGGLAGFMACSTGRRTTIEPCPRRRYRLTSATETRIPNDELTASRPPPRPRPARP